MHNVYVIDKYIVGSDFPIHRFQVWQSDFLIRLHNSISVQKTNENTFLILPKLLRNCDIFFNICGLLEIS